MIESDDALSDIRAALAPVFRMDAQMGFETKLMTTKHVFRHVETDFIVELFLLSDDPHDRMRFSRRFKRTRGTTEMYFPPAEDVIIQKLRWARRKDQDDIRAILKARADKLDWAYLQSWTQTHGTNALLDQLSAENLDPSDPDAKST